MPKGIKGFQKGHTPWCKGRKGLWKSTFKGKKRPELSGENHPMWGKHHSEEAKKKISKTKKRLGQAPSKKYWWTKENLPTKEMCEARARTMKGRKRPPFSEEWKKNLGKANKGRKLTKEHIRKCLRRRPMSGLEIKVDKVIKKYNLPYKFVGNGKFFIERKNPDFVNTNGEKIAIEVYCRRHKDYFSGGCDNWRKNRSKIFKEYGWEIIFIEDWQTNSENKILSMLGG